MAENLSDSYADPAKKWTQYLNVLHWQHFCQRRTSWPPALFSGQVKVMALPGERMRNDCRQFICHNIRTEILGFNSWLMYLFQSSAVLLLIFLFLFLQILVDSRGGANRYEIFRNEIFPRFTRRSENTLASWLFSTERNRSFRQFPDYLIVDSIAVITYQYPHKDARYDSQDEGQTNDLSSINKRTTKLCQRFHYVSFHNINWSFRVMYLHLTLVPAGIADVLFYNDWHNNSRVLCGVWLRKRRGVLEVLSDTFWIVISLVMNPVRWFDHFF